MKEKAEQDQCCRQVRRHHESEEAIVGLVDMPAQKRRYENAVPQAGDREAFGDTLQQSQHNGLQLRQHV